MRKVVVNLTPLIALSNIGKLYNIPDKRLFNDGLQQHFIHDILSKEGTCWKQTPSGDYR